MYANITGIISQDHDIQQMYLDCFLKIASVESNDAVGVINKLDEISKNFNVDFIISMTMDSSDIPEEIKDKVAVAL